MDAHLSEEQIEMLAAGEGEPEDAAHARACAPCAARLAAFVEEERRLMARLHRAACPDTLPLLETAAGLLPDASILAHLQRGCPHCEAELAQLQRWEALPLHVAPASQWAERVRILFGRLVPPPSAALLGLRGAVTAPATYEMGDLLLMLECQPSLHQGEHLSLHGSLLSLSGSLEQFAGSTVRLATEGAILQEEALSMVGSFTFNNLPQGNYRVSLDLPASYVIVDNVQVTDREQSN